MNRALLRGASVLLGAALFFSSALADPLPGLTAGETCTAAEVEAALAAQADPSTADLTDIVLTNADRKQLLADYPDTHFIWTVDVWGTPVSSEDTSVTLDPYQKGKLQDLCDALDCLPNLKNVEMGTTALTRDERDTLFFGYPDIEFGWTINVNASHTVLTDMTAFSTWGKKPKLIKYNMWNFVYCKHLKMLDVGHNSIMDLEFLRSCAKLKVLIAVDCCLTDISPLEDQTEIEYLELFMNNLTDISALASLTSLVDVNLAYNDITDLSPLYDLPHLERVWLMRNDHLSKEEVERLREHQPNCQIVTRSWGATGNMLDDDGNQIPDTSWRDCHRYDVVYAMSVGGGAHDFLDWDADVPQSEYGKKD